MTRNLLVMSGENKTKFRFERNAHFSRKFATVLRILFLIFSEILRLCSRSSQFDAKYNVGDIFINVQIVFRTTPHVVCTHDAPVTGSEFFGSLYTAWEKTKRVPRTNYRRNVPPSPAHPLAVSTVRRFASCFRAHGRTAARRRGRRVFVKYNAGDGKMQTIRGG